MKLGHKRVSSEEYKQMKALLDMGIKMSQVMKISGRSYGTVKDVGKYPDLATFNRERRSGWLAWSAKHKGNGVTKKETPVMKTDVSLDKSKIDIIIAKLERIASALELMEGHWRPTSEKKRFKLFS